MAIQEMEGNGHRPLDDITNVSCRRASTNSNRISREGLWRACHFRARRSLGMNRPSRIRPVVQCSEPNPK